MGQRTTNRWRALAVLIGVSLAGCSLMSQVSRETETYPTRSSRFGLFDWAGLLEPTQTLRPGVGLVTVQSVGCDRTRISWRSPWPGSSVVRYGLEHRLLPHASRETLPTEHTTVELPYLASGVRHFFQVETVTALGGARSAICSFLAPTGSGVTPLSTAQSTQSAPD